MTNSELLLTTLPSNKDLPRYIKVVGMTPDSYCTTLIIDRQRISIVDPEKYRIRVDGVWVLLWNEAKERCGS